MAIEGHIEAIEKEFKEVEENKAWNQLYQKVRTEGTYNDLSCAIARTIQNKNLNRYRDVLPYDHSRIILHGSNTDYINASLLEVESVNRKYILSQGPLAQTTPHFWLLVWQQKCKGIVMLNKVMEKNQIKCHQYWPLGEKRGGDKLIEYPSVNLKVELLKEAAHSHYIYRTFRLTNTSTNESREILHFHYTTWPDFGVPQSPEAFYKFLSVVCASKCMEPQYGPAVIHCSAGIGRSGTFCLVDTILKMLSHDLCTSEPGKVLEVLLDMRKYRMGLIQTADQLRFSYQAILYGAHRLNETNGKGLCKTFYMDILPVATANVTDPSEESSSEELSHEEAPPMPPPRTDSLTRSMLESELGLQNDETADTDEDGNDLDDDQKRILTTGIYQRENNDDSTDIVEEQPLPLEPATSSSPESSVPTTPDNPPNSNSSILIAATSSTPESSIQTAPDNPPESSVPTTPDNPPTSYSDLNDVLRRRRMDRIASTSAKVDAIKKKSREAEQWQDRKKLLFGPISVCAALLFVGLGGGLIYYYKQFQS